MAASPSNWNLVFSAIFGTKGNMRLKLYIPSANHTDNIIHHSWLF